MHARVRHIKRKPLFLCLVTTDNNDLGERKGHQPQCSNAYLGGRKGKDIRCSDLMYEA
jgi:hypothetical protein